MFVDRQDAGRQLAARLADYPLPRPLVLALPRGGLPVAAPVAEVLGANLDVLVVHKLGVPGNPEVAMGAVGEGGVVIIDHSLRRELQINSDQVDQMAADERREVERRVQMYRGSLERLDAAGRNVIIVDDGLATGSTATAAVAAVKQGGACHVTVAVPVGSRQAIELLRAMADDVICLDVPEQFTAVGRHYRDFDQISDDKVMTILAAHPRLSPSAGNGQAVFDSDVQVDFDGGQLIGHLTIPARSGGIVLFAHGGGSSHLSPRNVAVAQVLNAAGIGTLLLDLLTTNEADTRTNIFDIEMLAGRLVQATGWLQKQPLARGRRIGYFGASTGAAAALVAAAMLPDVVSAVVSRGGRPDLAGDWLSTVAAPTLLIVGGNDFQTIDINRSAQQQLQCPNLLEIVRGATHLFQEPGTLAQAARLAQSWFVQNLR